MTTNKNTRCGYVALIGAPNAGKSTLLNRMVGSKIAIVTPKVQTTRNRILGLTISGDTQLIFMDTPGIFGAKKKFEKAMVKSALDGAKDADIVVLMVDAYKGLCENTKHIIEQLKTADHLKKLLVINKIDTVKKDRLPKLIKEMYNELDFTDCFLISADKGDGVLDLKKYLASHLPESPWLYDEDTMTDVPMRQLASEVTREKLFMRLQQELPYSVAVETESWEEKDDGSVKIQQVVYVRSESQKMIVLGKGGAMLKQVGQSSRTDLTKLMKRKVHLFLFVKVAEKWKENKEFYETIGLEFEQ